LLKIPARYVSGYLATESASATPRLGGGFIPGPGWRALDPTHNCQINETYVKIGTTGLRRRGRPLAAIIAARSERKMEVEVQDSSR